MRKIFKIFPITALILCNISFAQESDSAIYATDEINVISNRVATDIFSSPTRVEVISKEKIINRNGETLSDLLSLGSGIFIKSYSGNSGLSTISLNGMGAEHTLILMNGFKINSFQNAQLDLTTISKENIERIEILNNGASSLYGSEAMGGVVNIITRSPLAYDLGIKFNAQFGSYSQSKYSISANKRFSGFYINYSQSIEKSENDYEFYLGNNYSPRRRQNSGYRIKNYSVDASLLLNQSKLNFFSSYSDIFRKLPGAVSMFSSFSNSQQKDRNWFNYISWEKFLQNNFKLSTSLNFQNNLMNYTDGSESMFGINSFYKNLVYSANILLEKKFSDSKFASGIEAVYASIKSNELDPSTRRIQFGAFTASELKLNKFKVFPSVRFDHISDIDENVITGKLGGNYKPFDDEDLHLRFSAGNNFSAPTFNELYWKELGNKELKPERSNNFDIGIIFRLNFIGEILFDAVYTKIYAKDKIVWKPVSSNIWKPLNIGRSESDVISFSGELRKNYSENFLVRIKQSYTHTGSLKKSMDLENDPSFDKQIFYIPRQMFKTEAELSYKGAGLNLYYSFIGKRFTDFENIFFLPAVDILDGNIFYKIVNKDKISMTFKFEVNNILDTRYSIIQDYPMPLRNYKLNLTFEY